jgi:DNA-binding response OmpR family regulator
MPLTETSVIMSKAENRKIHRILVVDDEPRILRFVRLSLCSCGFEVITAGDGHHALTLIDAEKPDLMILDIFMPGLDGFGVLQRLRELENEKGLTHLPVIVFSARTSVAPKALSLGADDFILKPFQPEEMAEKVRQTIAHAA